MWEDSGKDGTAAALGYQSSPRGGGGGGGNVAGAGAGSPACARDSAFEFSDPEKEAQRLQVTEMRASVNAMEEELSDNFKLTKPQQYALKKKMQMERASMLRLERELKAK